VDHHRNSGNPVAAWLFRAEHKSKLPANRQLDPYFDRYRRHTHRFEPVGDRLEPRFVENRRSDQIGCLSMHNTRKEISNVVHNRNSSNNTVCDWLLAIKPTT